MTQVVNQHPASHDGGALRLPGLDHSRRIDHGHLGRPSDSPAASPESICIIFIMLQGCPRGRPSHVTLPLAPSEPGRRFPGNLCVDLVGVRQAIDQADLSCVVGRIGTAVDQGAGRVERDPLPRGDRLGHHRVAIVENRDDLLAKLRAHRGARIGLAGALEVADLNGLGIDANTVEKRLVEVDLGGEPLEHQPAAFGHDDLVGGGRDQVIGVTGHLENGDRLLARRPEALDRLAKLVALGPAERDIADPEYEALDVLVVPRLGQGIDERLEIVGDRLAIKRQGRGRFDDAALERQVNQNRGRRLGRAGVGLGGGEHHAGIHREG